jgi:predicted Zn-dependent protease with MMP-like domain
MDREEFEKIVISAIESVPEQFREKIENLDFVIDEHSIVKSESPSGQKSGKITLALYQGVPLTKRRGASPVFPDKITIYKKAIESVSRTDSETKKTIRRVVLHELGHYFGFGEKKLKELGY